MRHQTQPMNPFLDDLTEHETILWQGKPHKRSYIWRGSWYFVAISLMWGGFAIFLEVLVILSQAPFIVLSLALSYC